MHKIVLCIFTACCILSALVAPALTPAAIIADHTVVDQYDKIPAYYMNEVKKMWLDVPGESHSLGYRKGLQLLAQQNSLYAVSVTESGTPEAYRSDALRASRATWGDVDTASGWIYGFGEEDFWTSQTAIDRTKAHLTYANTHSLAIAAFGFGWCWDTTWTNGPGGTVDPVYNVRWAGSTVGGPDGNLRWGLDDGDTALTGNSLNMDDYLAAVDAYRQHCADNSYTTKVFFTTSPVDGYTGESGYQRYLKHEHIRQHVLADDDRILFDYADILCYSNAGALNETTWTDGTGTLHRFQHIHPDNMLDLNGSYVEDGDHIGEVGTVRLAKALWWMLARMAGWNGIDNSTSTTTTILASSSTTTVMSSSTTTIGSSSTTTPISSTTTIGAGSSTTTADSASTTTIGATTTASGSTTTTAPPAQCLDSDGDTYGENCPAGPDCNDDDPFLYDTCPTCTVKFIPKTLGWLFGERKAVRFLFAIGSPDAAYDENTTVRWDTDAIEMLRKWPLFKHFMLLKVRIDGAALEKGGHRVLIGDCLATLGLAK